MSWTGQKTEIEVEFIVLNHQIHRADHDNKYNISSVNGIFQKKTLFRPNNPSVHQIT